MYLLGFLEFPDILMIFTKSTLYVLTSGKKCKCTMSLNLRRHELIRITDTLLEAILKHNETSKVKLELLKRNKQDGNKENFEKLMKVLQGSKKIGMLRKETPQGNLVAQFMEVLNSEKEMEQVEVGKGVELCIVVKEESELEICLDCNQANNHGEMLLCDGCDGTHHV